MINKLYALALAAGLGIGALAVPVTTASATIVFMPNQLGAIEADGTNGLLQKANHRRSHVFWDRRRHGDRSRYRRDRYRHYYGGYYYINPWWLVTAPLVIGSTRRYSGGSRHVEWCFSRYRSYNPRYNTWVSYSGRVNQCYSPYN